MRPPSWLKARPRFFMLMQELRLAGSSPENELPPMSRISRRRRRPRLGGISPYSSFELKFRLCKKLRFPMTGGSPPARLPEGSVSAATRAGVRRSHVTPSQLQKLVLLFQEASALELLPLNAALKASNVASSLLLLLPPPATAAT
ncbi:Os01g0152850, partial [Oryza sativa Japonica Group]